MIEDAKEQPSFFKVLQQKIFKTGLVHNSRPAPKLNIGYKQIEEQPEHIVDPMPLR